jgi:hypothetical protein
VWCSAAARYHRRYDERTHATLGGRISRRRVPVIAISESHNVVTAIDVNHLASDP